MARQTNPLRQRLRDAAAEAMLEAAERAMVKKGYEATMQEIAAEAGCATGTFYLYFRNKEVLFGAIVARHAQTLFAAARAAMAETNDPLEQVRRSVACHLQYVHHHKGFFRLFFTALPMRQRALHSKLSPHVRQQQDDYNQLEREALREAQKQGQIRCDLPADLLQEFMEAAGLSIVERFLFSNNKQSVEEQVNIVWGLVTGGIGARSSHERS